MFVEEGFRIRFANGESIDFYADNKKEKDRWMQALSTVFGKDGATIKPTWMSAVLARERVLASQGAKKHQIDDYDVPLRGGSRSVPTSPRKPVPAPAESAASRTDFMAPTGLRQQQHDQVSPAKHASMPNPPQQGGMMGGMSFDEKRRAQRQAVRSMMF